MGTTLALVGPEMFSFRQLLEPMPGVKRLPRAIASVPLPPTRGEVRLLHTDKVAGTLPTPPALRVEERSLGEGLPASPGEAP
jgi:hypothetical protein